MENKSDHSQENDTQEKSFFGIIVHSFFIIPFLIAVFCVLVFVTVRILTLEQHTVYDYLEDVKTGGLTKRWQAAFELSKILAKPELIPQDDRFVRELIHAFEESEHDDDRVRQYLALAMGRTGNTRFLKPLLVALNDEKEENLYALIYSLGILQDQQAAEVLYPYLDHAQARIRLSAVMALGNIGDRGAIPFLQKSLRDSEPNVQWDAAIALAKMEDLSGQEILKNLLDREYLKKFPEVDPQEQNHIMLVVLESLSGMRTPKLNAMIQNLADNDQNMKIRQAALKHLNTIH